MLIRAAGAATADVPLLFAADTIRELRMADGNTVFEEGRDYVPANGGDAEVDAGDPAGSGTPSDHFDVGDSRLRELQALITEMSKVAPCPLSGPR